MEKNLFLLKKFFSQNKMENYIQMNVSTLKHLARERGLHGYSKLRKSELIEQIKNPSPLEYTRTQSIQLARERGLRGYSKLRKYQLLQRLIGNGDQILNREKDARMANVPFLTPTPYTPPQATPSSSSSNDVDDLIINVDKATKRPKKAHLIDLLQSYK